MNTRTSLLFTAVLAAGLVSGAAQAALLDRGGGLIYDTDLNVTWLQDANYAQTSGYDADGLMDWNTATSWAANLSYYDSIRNVTYTDWRLPTTTDLGAPGYQYSYRGTDGGYNVDPASSEMAHLYFVDLENTSAYTTGGTFKGGTAGGEWGLVNNGSFTNFQSGSYWSGTEYAPNPSFAWVFNTRNGYQYYSTKTDSRYVLAVRPGDVAVVPEPEAWGLMVSGLGLVGFAARRRTRSTRF